MVIELIIKYDSHKQVVPEEIHIQERDSEITLQWREAVHDFRPGMTVSKLLDVYGKAKHYVYPVSVHKMKDWLNWAVRDGITVGISTDDGPVDARVVAMEAKNGGDFVLYENY